MCWPTAPSAGSAQSLVDIASDTPLKKTDFPLPVATTANSISPSAVLGKQCSFLCLFFERGSHYIPPEDIVWLTGF